MTAALGLLILTGARLREILTLRWDYVDLSNAVLRLPDSKTGAKLIYINDAAIKLLAEIPRLAGNSFVIVGRKPGSIDVADQIGRQVPTSAGLRSERAQTARETAARARAGAHVLL